jgi:hypothetical protein
LSGGKGGTERVASDLANAMAERNMIVHIAHKHRGSPAYNLEDNVFVFSYSSLKELEEYIVSINPDVYFVFYFGRHLINFYSLIHAVGIPFGMQECTNPERVIINNWGANNKNRLPVPHRRWEREVIASAANRIRLTMPCYASSFPKYIKGNVKAFPNPAFQQKLQAKPGTEGDTQKVIINVGGIQNGLLKCMVKQMREINRIKLRSGSLSRRIILRTEYLFADQLMISLRSLPHHISM